MFRDRPLLYEETLHRHRGELGHQLDGVPPKPPGGR